MDLSISDDTDALLCDDQEKENGSESAEKESEEMEDDWDYAEEDDKAYGEEEEEDDDDDDVESEEEDDAENHDPFNARQSSHQRAPSKTQSSANKDKPSNTNLRRSGRERTSTVIHVKGGHTIKKDNNYTVKGTSYSYGTVTEADLQVKKKKVSKYVAKTNKPAANKSTPMRSSQETNRLQYKRDVEQSIQIKQPLRQAFLKQHLSVLSPFIEPKVKARIEQHEGRQTKELQVFMQPDAIQTELRDYQLQGLQWMARMHAHNMGMILGDEMGLGKTIQTVSLVSYLKEQYATNGPSLIICPMSVLYSWCNEIKKWAPSLKYLRFHSSATDDVSIHEEDLSQYDMVVTTYEMVKSQNLRRIWQRQTFHLLVLDEGHRIKCEDTQTAQAVRKIHCETRIILTGTPLANNLVEMYSLLNFLAPDVFTTSEPFADAFDLTNKKVDTAKLDQAHSLLSVFMLRRLKEKVEKLMPKMLETKIVCPLSTMQIWWYKAILLKDIGLLANGTGSNGQLANLIMQLRKCCLHPFLFDGAEDIESTTLETLIGASGKLAVLDKLLCSLYEKKHRVCLFSQFTQVLDILEDYCTMRGWKFCRFDGSTARAKRNYVVNAFNAPDSDKFIFLMSTRSGSMGLNLQTADTCILYDSDWNPALDNQAMARVHRLGQTKTVHAYRLVTQGTVEQRMIERAEKKNFLDRVVVRDGSDPAATAAASANVDEGDEKQEAGKLLETLQFGCSAVFGQGSINCNQLPSDEDIALITDRHRTDDFSQGNLKGGTVTEAGNFDATKDFTSTTDFAGIDFTEIRKEYEQQKRPKTVSDISVIWQTKREIKNRIQMVEAKGSGYGSAVPVLKSNDYDLETGERSVFDQELRGKKDIRQKKKEKVVFDHQDFCQVCGGGGEVVLCPRCPVAVHLGRCAGVTRAKDFACCSHHLCAVCGKSSSNVGGFIFPCSTCPSAYCEDHLPAEAKFLEPCERMESFGFAIHLGVYVHCSKQCEHVAMQEHAYKPPGEKIRDPCPPRMNLSSHFGGEVDASFEAPEDVILHHKRERKPVRYNMSESEAQNKRGRHVFDCPDDDKDEDFVLIEGQSRAPKTKPTFKWQPAVAPVAPIHVLVDGHEVEPPAKRKKEVPRKADMSVLPLHPGGYDVTIPATESGVGIVFGMKDSDVTFRGYRALADGSRGFAERYSLVRNEGDALVMVNGVCTRGMAKHTVTQLIMESIKGKASDSIQLRFFDIAATRYGFDGTLPSAAPIIPEKCSEPAATAVAVHESVKTAVQLDFSNTHLGMQYTVVLPTVGGSLLINVRDSRCGTIFTGYRPQPDGSMGPAESLNLIRNIGDKIISVDGSCMTHMSHKTVLWMLRESALTQSSVSLVLSENPDYLANSET